MGSPEFQVTACLGVLAPVTAIPQFTHRNSQMPCNPHPRVDIAGVAAMEIAKGAAERILVARDSHDVDVVRHQATGPDLDPVAFCCLGEQVEVERIIAILEERPLAPVAALGHVMGNAWQDHAGETGHAGALTHRDKVRQFRGLCTRHRNSRTYLYPGTFSRLRQQITIQRIVRLLEERLLPTVAALRHVIG